MKLWDHLWAGVVVSLAIGVFLIGTSGYYWASNSKRQREIDRHTKEMLTGVEPPAPDPEQVARNWNRDLLVGATVGGVLWILGNVIVFGKAWKDRGRESPGQSGGAPEG
jgi:hypothetical protein